MTWDQLTDLDKREIEGFYTTSEENSDERQDFLASKYEVTSRTVRNWLQRLNITQSTHSKSFSNHYQYINALERRLPSKSIYALTWEQNKTPIYENLWRNIIAYMKFLDGHPIVIQGRYQNPTSIWKDAIKNEGWSKTTEEFQYADRLSLHPFLEGVADIKVRPTATYPLTGLETLTGLNTGIIGHPKMHLKTVSMPKSYRKKVLLTTGAISVANYTDSKSGARSNPKHKLGFAIVEIKDDDIFYIRQVEADDNGNFYDLFFQVRDGVVAVNNRTMGIVFGDTHVGCEDPTIMEKNKELVKLLNPKKVAYHDIIDGISVNNHILKDPISQYKRYKKGEHLIESEIEKLIEFLDTNKRKNSYIVNSNHDTRFSRYIQSMDWKKDIANSEMYMKMASALLSGEADKGIIPWIISQHFDDDIYHCLEVDESLIIGKYEAGMHGHQGSNGSRGGLNQFSKIDIPSITAHSHTTSRIDDTFIVGTNTKYDLGYNVGPSNWLQSNVIIHPNGIAQHVIFIEGEYTTLKKFL